MQHDGNSDIRNFLANSERRTLKDFVLADNGHVSLQLIKPSKKNKSSDFYKVHLMKQSVRQLY
jgi:hypothetical protein